MNVKEGLSLALMPMLLVDWVARLARDAGLPLTSEQRNANGFLLDTTARTAVAAEIAPKELLLRFEAKDPAQQPLIDEIVRQAQARRRIDQNDLGDVIWFSASVQSKGKR
jgi:hypothetical protein